MKKGAIILLMGVALYFVLKNYYAQGNQGIPNPETVMPAFYLYGLLALSTEFLDNFPVILAAALTVALIWRVQDQTKTTNKQPTTTKKAS